ncbi:glycoside hydrolase family 26 protein [Kocuria sabuli]|uniref:glycoside hydrolase family 26 protein n=1 Tax=Kocuria sabuli TaxID=3071448 RepID=UPI0034D533CD
MTTTRPDRAVPSLFRTCGEHGRQPTRRAVLLGMGSLMLTGCSGPLTPPSFPPPARTRPLEVGVCLPEGPQDRGSVQAYNAMVGSPAQWMLLFCDWALEHPPWQALDAARGQGAVPILTWEPWQAPSTGEFPSPAVDQPRFALLRIAAGEHDDHIRAWAQELAHWGQDVVLRFAHEMNGNWYTWGAGVQGNTPEHYVQAWHHVRDIFAAAGADNVRWCWAPNIPDGLTTENSGSLMDHFPGPEAVDLLGLDGYNWGPAGPAGWIEPSALLHRGIQELRSLGTDLPIIITETASAEEPEDGGAKAAWITQLFAYLQQQGDVRATVWFHLDKELDWRINSSLRAQTAYRNAVAQLGQEVMQK